MTFYRENFKASIKKLIELVNKFSNVGVYKITIQNSVVFLYISNKKKLKLKENFTYNNKNKTCKNKIKNNC